MKTYETELTVRYAETDQMGVVHHSRYYPWFEVGRTELFAKGGLRYGDMERAGIMMPMVETQCRYIIPARYEDRIIIKTYVIELSPVKVKFGYDVVRKVDDTLLAQGSTLMAFTDLNFRPVNMKKYNPNMWDYVCSLK